MRFPVLTAASMKIRAFLDIAQCSLVGVNRRFRGAYCLHHQGHHRVDDGCVLPPSSGWWSPWLWRQYACLKRRSTPTRLHGTTSQKALIFNRVLIYLAPQRSGHSSLVDSRSAGHTNRYFYGTQRLSCSQEPTTGTYRKPNESCPQFLALFSYDEF
jgi:hypothetical protein